MRKIGLMLIILVCLVLASVVQGSDRIRLRDVDVLTLHDGQWTKGRRGSPVPQLKCVGGSAENQFKPKVVQCYNRGWDGSSVQWECKTDMDNDFRFGEIMVTCEGFDYAGDDYILKGSCGLEYSLDYTKEGQQNRYNSHDHHSNEYQHSNKKSTGFGDLVFLFIIGCIIYVVYRWCISTSATGSQTGSASGQPGNGPGGGGPPPPGFRPDYQPPPPYSEKDNHQSAGAQYRGASAPPPQYDSDTNRQQQNNDRPGFWTGMGTGGMLGYLFGRSGSNTGYASNYGYGSQRSSWWNSRPRSSWSDSRSHSWDSQPSSSRGFSSNRNSTSSSRSSGTRTASGFGGTNVR